ncbi:MAG: hypothetical protein F6K35_35375 [Okeania sp. SIO2H7]|uniref:hypothetical protein n=1 Tax=unclassified Okeania TaxID=2634635 RepID=UPI0013BFCC10|nr:MULTISPECIES: hypothetical protein [unclassified Okeania]NEP44224.1 hypothetical protein [Okeania sp. SIO2H7]NEP72660.1 hypothetical protein [Okeania sp. SIO2G5]
MKWIIDNYLSLKERGLNKREIFSLLVDWIWRGDPFLQTRSEDRHPTLREAALTTACFSFKGEDFYLNYSVKIWQKAEG